MSDGTAGPNNPERVPPLLSAIDGPQAGAPRFIHPIGLMVGVPARERTAMDSTASFTVPETGTYMDDTGGPIAYRAGDKIPLGRAVEFAEFRKLMNPPVEAFVPADAGSSVVTTAATSFDHELPVDPAALDREELTWLREQVATLHERVDQLVERLDEKPSTLANEGQQDQNPSGEPEVLAAPEVVGNAGKAAELSTDEKGPELVATEEQKPGDKPDPKPKGPKTRETQNAPENRALPGAPENR